MPRLLLGILSSPEFHLESWANRPGKGGTAKGTGRHDRRGRVRSHGISCGCAQACHISTCPTLLHRPVTSTSSTYSPMPPCTSISRPITSTRPSASIPTSLPPASRRSSWWVHAVLAREPRSRRRPDHAQGVDDVLCDAAPGDRAVRRARGPGAVRAPVDPRAARRPAAGGDAPRRKVAGREPPHVAGQESGGAQHPHADEGGAYQVLSGRWLRIYRRVRFCVFCFRRTVRKLLGEADARVARA